MTEIKAPDGYILQDTPKTFEIKDGGSMELVFTNKKAYGLQIRKIVKDTGEALPGAKFRVEKATGELIGEYTSNSSGLVTVSGLEDGVYVVTEIKAPDGYRLDSTPQNVIVKAGELTIFKPDGKNFPNTSINRIIKNSIYVGIIHKGESCSGVIPDLQIIDQDTYDRAQRLMEARATHHKDTPLNMRGRSLLVGNIFCGHCKHRLTLTTSGRKRINRYGELIRETRCRYQCHYNLRHPGECDGQSGYGVKKLDGILDKIIRYQFSKIKASNGKTVIEAQHEKQIELARARHKLACMQLSEKQKELDDYRAETIRVIRGESRLDIDLLNSLIADGRAEVERLSAAAENAKYELDECLASKRAEQEEYERLGNWADLYANCTFEARKMIACQFIKSVYVYRDYTLEIEFNVSFEDFKTLETQCGGTENEEVAIHVTA